MRIYKSITYESLSKILDYDSDLGKFYRKNPDNRALSNPDGSVLFKQIGDEYSIRVMNTRVNVLDIAWIFISGDKPTKGFDVVPRNGDYSDIRKTNLFLCENDKMEHSH